MCPHCYFSRNTDTLSTATKTAPVSFLWDVLYHSVYFSFEVERPTYRSRWYSIWTISRNSFPGRWAKTTHGTRHPESRRHSVPVLLVLFRSGTQLQEGLVPRDFQPAGKASCPCRICLHLHLFIPKTPWATTENAVKFPFIFSQRATAGRFFRNTQFSTCAHCLEGKFMFFPRVSVGSSGNTMCLRIWISSCKFWRVINFHCRRGEQQTRWEKLKDSLFGLRNDGQNCVFFCPRTQTAVHQKHSSVLIQDNQKKMAQQQMSLCEYFDLESDKKVPVGYSGFGNATQVTRMMCFVFQVCDSLPG